MALLVMSNRQLLSGVAITVSLVSAIVWLFLSIFMYLDLPDVHINTENKCVKVVNFRNGDGFTCSDVDVILRKYKTVHIK